ncbi:MAG: hypothetical protein CVV41_14325 [Candidatus Riflebacteria bacterium HGW-Riflebacteria-1]|jgi:hypothetical protein|nr:MAG: hypothetical protein CVV41_14325 [Candidatus Riflebacteria bacterium HGW-Riflebacteria-1]
MKGTRDTKKKKRVQGVVDRITAGIVVVVVRHPDDPEAMQEIYVPREKFKNRDLQEGDYVSVDIE